MHTERALPSVKRSSRGKSFLYGIRKHKLHFTMILPVLLWYALFKYVPLYGITLAFKEFRLLGGIAGSPWVGFDNFARLFQSYDFFTVFRNTVVMAGLNLLFGFPAPVLLALFINELRGNKFKRVAQSISYLPHFISWVILAGIFMEVLSPSRGPVNAIIKAVSGKTIYFLGNAQYFRGTLVVTNIWKTIGWSSIVYLAALGGVNEELYDAARVDGCGRWARIWHVTLPGITPVVTIMLILKVGEVMEDNFDQVFNLLNPAVYSVGDVLGTYIYRQGVTNMDYSYSTAVELFRNLISLGLVLGANFVSKRVNEYGLW
ncbi:MAG: ABC transporter permease subunit [Oscillospiraceae bacterium]|jgi:putative aldouronate transport system permease protein|nr:ABC transporter permease subunit [Oscillospiraceae bacterium]